jgi:hypothetical protein
VILGGPLVLFPAHVVFLEFVIDPDLFHRLRSRARRAGHNAAAAARAAGTTLIGGLPFALAVLEGAIALAFTTAVYWISVALSRPEAQARGLAFRGGDHRHVSLIFFARAGGRRVWAPHRGGKSRALARRAWHGRRVSGSRAAAVAARAVSASRHRIPSTWSGWGRLPWPSGVPSAALNRVYAVVATPAASRHYPACG